MVRPGRPGRQKAFCITGYRHITVRVHSLRPVRPARDRVVTLPLLRPAPAHGHRSRPSPTAGHARHLPPVHAPSTATRQVSSASSSQRISRSSRSSCRTRSSASSLATVPKSVALSAILACRVVSFSPMRVQLPLDALEFLLRGAGVRSRGTGRGRRRSRRRTAAAGGFHGGAAAFEVLVDPARQHPQGGVAEQREDPVGGALDEVAVVADDHQGSRPAVEEVLELGQGLDVEVVGGLVEEEHVGLVHQQPQELQPAALTAGQVADRRPLPSPW